MKQTSRKASQLLFIICSFLVAVLLVSFFAYQYKWRLIQDDFTNFLQQQVERRFGYQIKLGSIEGRLGGWLKIEDLSLSISGASTPIFESSQVHAHYHITDLFKSNYGGVVKVYVKNPTIYIDALAATQDSSKKGFGFLAHIIDRVKNKSILYIENGRVIWPKAGEVSSISGEIRNRGFALELLLDHLHFGRIDIASELHIKGDLSRKDNGRSVLDGTVTTRRSILNWKPVLKESEFTISMDENGLQIKKANLLGGISVKGELTDFSNPKWQLRIFAERYPLSYLENAMPLSSGRRLLGVMDADLKVEGALLNPMIRGRFALKETIFGTYPIKNLQLDLAGVYPDTNLSISQIVLQDGTAMQLAGEGVSVKELFDTQTYERLIRVRDQEDVKWGDWRLKRRGWGEVSMEREFEDFLKLRYEQHDEGFVPTEGSRQEVEMEYLLSGENSLKIRKTEDGEFVGVQKKMEF